MRDYFRSFSVLAAGALVAAALSGCASDSLPQTPAQRLYALEAAYSASVGEMASYEARPRCGSAGADPYSCSEPAAVAAMRRADDSIYPVLQAARQNPTDTTVSALDAALRTLRASLSEIAK